MEENVQTSLIAKIEEVLAKVPSLTLEGFETINNSCIEGLFTNASVLHCIHIKKDNRQEILNWIKAIMESRRIYGDYLLLINSVSQHGMQGHLIWAKVFLEPNYRWVEHLWRTNSSLCFLRINKKKVFAVSSDGDEVCAFSRQCP